MPFGSPTQGGAVVLAPNTARIDSSVGPVNPAELSRGKFLTGLCRPFEAPEDSSCPQTMEEPSMPPDDHDKTTKQALDARFQKLFERYARKVYAYFRSNGFPHEDAEDLTQDTFRRVYSSMDTIRGNVEAQENSFARTTAARLRANILRDKAALKRKAELVSLGDLEKAPGESEDFDVQVAPLTPEALLGLATERTTVYRAICGLPSNLRCCLLLWLMGLQLKEIQAAMGISMDAVKSRLRDGKKRVAQSVRESAERPGPPEEDDDRQE